MHTWCSKAPGASFEGDFVAFETDAGALQRLESPFHNNVELRGPLMHGSLANATRLDRRVLLSSSSRACAKKEEAPPPLPRPPHRPRRSKARSTSSRGPATSSAAKPTRTTTGSPQFEKDTGCKVNVKVAGTSDEMVSLMTQGGYDLVTASGDASLRLIRGNTVQPVGCFEDSQLRHRRQAPAGSAVALRGWQALRRALSVGPERAHVQHEGVQEAADLLVRGVRAAEAAGRQAEQGPRAGV